MTLFQMSIHISLVFINSTYSMELMGNSSIREQIKEFLLSHTEERGRIILMQDTNEVSDRSSIRGGSIIDCMILKDNHNIRSHAIQCGYNANALTYCGNIAFASTETYTPIIVENL